LNVVRIDFDGNSLTPVKEFFWQQMLLYDKYPIC